MVTRLAGRGDPVVTGEAGARHRTVVHAGRRRPRRVLWQLSQELALGIWFPGLPVAVEPLWQVAQLPVTALWSKRTLDQLLVM